VTNYKVEALDTFRTFLSDAIICENAQTST